MPCIGCVTNLPLSGSNRGTDKMNEKKILPDDPRLTAYALGELDAEESAEIARAIDGDYEAQAVVDEVRVLAGRLEDVLADEPIEPVSARQHDNPAADLGEDRKVLHFPYAWAAGLAAAACFAVLLVLRPTSGSRTETSSATVAQARTEAPIASSSVPADTKGSALASTEVKASLPQVGPDDSPISVETSSPIPAARAVASAEQPAIKVVPGAAASDGGSSESWSGPSDAGAIALRTTRGAADARRNRQLSPLANYGSEAASATQPHHSSPNYAYQPAKGFLGVAGYPLSAFPTVVGTESYANVRRFLRNGRLPPPDSVRVEELLNYFSYGSIAPRDANPLAASLEVAAAPWNPSHRLVRIGLKGRDVSELQRASDSRPLEESMGNGMVAVAKDVKLQVEFNPEQAKSYRLIGYDEDSAARTDANGAKIPGTEMPAGHMITALFEVVPVGAPSDSAIDGDPLRYAGTESRLASTDDPKHRELLTLKVHYKLPVVEVSQKLEIPLIDTGADFSVASKDFKFAAAVAGFGMLLTESPHKGTATYDKVLTWAQEGQDKEDKSDKRRDFIDLVKRAKDAPVE
ncbi:hypothetical protein DB347_01240 [Opitutaceae bacterium EW11]|nr:hypothetical protein DB347_01240 [Opitutaceae bacterium EW11]